MKRGAHGHYLARSERLIMSVTRGGDTFSAETRVLKRKAVPGAACLRNDVRNVGLQSDMSPSF